MTRSSNDSRDASLSATVSSLVTRLQTATGLVDAAGCELLGINATDLRILEALLRRGTVSASEVASAVGLSRGATTTALDRLERRGFVVRVRSERDRRGVLVNTTSTTRQLAGAIWGPIGLAGADLLGGFSEAELRVVHRFLEASCDLQEAEAERIRALPTHVNRNPVRQSSDPLGG